MNAYVGLLKAILEYCILYRWFFVNILFLKYRIYANDLAQSKAYLAKIFLFTFLEWMPTPEVFSFTWKETLQYSVEMPI